MLALKRRAATCHILHAQQAGFPLVGNEKWVLTPIQRLLAVLVVCTDWPHLTTITLGLGLWGFVALLQQGLACWMLKPEVHSGLSQQINLDRVGDTGSLLQRLCWQAAGGMLHAC